MPHTQLPAIVPRLLSPIQNTTPTPQTLSYEDRHPRPRFHPRSACCRCSIVRRAQALSSRLRRGEKWNAPIFPIEGGRGPNPRRRSAVHVNVGRVRDLEKESMREGGAIVRMGWFDLYRGGGSLAHLQSNGIVAHVQSHGHGRGYVHVEIGLRITPEEEAMREGRMRMGWRGLLGSKTRLTRELRGAQFARLSTVWQSFFFARSMASSLGPKLFHRWNSLG